MKNDITPLPKKIEHSKSEYLYYYLPLQIEIDNFDDSEFCKKFKLLQKDNNKVINFYIKDDKNLTIIGADSSFTLEYLYNINHNMNKADVISAFEKDLCKFEVYPNEDEWIKTINSLRETSDKYKAASNALVSTLHLENIILE